MTEGACDGVEDALRGQPDEEIAPGARLVIQHMLASGELRRALEMGLDVSKTIEKLKSGTNGWSNIPAAVPTHEVPQLGAVAWNFDPSPEAMTGNNQKKAGILITIRDANLDRGAGEAIGVAEALEEVTAGSANNADLTAT
ncbi:MAG: hypothetical protein Q8R44_14485 [Novosphingobium sp.]|nr:hypothetical protein [Novosphingobium sp.]